MKVAFEGDDEVGIAGKIAKMIIGLVHREEAIESKYENAAYDDDSALLTLIASSWLWAPSTTWPKKLSTT